MQSLWHVNPPKIKQNHFQVSILPTKLQCTCWLITMKWIDFGIEIWSWLNTTTHFSLSYKKSCRFVKHESGFHAKNSLHKRIAYSFVTTLLLLQKSEHLSWASPGMKWRRTLKVLEIVLKIKDDYLILHKIKKKLFQWLEHTIYL